jgi:hypothetical protein
MVEEQTQDLRFQVQVPPRLPFFHEIFLICQLYFKISLNFLKIVQFNIFKTYLYMFVFNISNISGKHLPGH